MCRTSTDPVGSTGVISTPSDSWCRETSSSIGLPTSPKPTTAIFSLSFTLFASFRLNRAGSYAGIHGLLTRRYINTTSPAVSVACRSLIRLRRAANPYTCKVPHRQEPTCCSVHATRRIFQCWPALRYGSNRTQDSDDKSSSFGGHPIDL